MSENEPLLKKAEAAVRNLFEDMRNVTVTSIERTADAELVIKLRFHERIFKMRASVRSSGEPASIRETGVRMRSERDKSAYPIIIAPYVSPNGRAICRELDIGFIDLCGNALIEFESLLIDRYGIENKSAKKRLQRSLFSPKASRVSRALLEAPMSDWTMAGIAKASGVSLGQVYKVLQLLAFEGYVEKQRGAIKMLKPGALLDEWAGTYRYDKQEITGFYCPLKDRDAIFSSLKALDEYALTLGAGAAIVAPFVRSTDTYVYARWPERIIKALDLKPVEFGGNFYIITPSDDGVLLNTQTIDGIRIVSNVQLYLDLFNYPMRGKEQAGHLREKLMGF